MKRALLCAGLLGAAVAAPAAEGEGSALSASGSIGAVGWHTDDTLVRHRDGAGGRLRLEVEGRSGDLQALLRAEAASSHDMASARGGNRVREAWLRYRAAAADVTLGRQPMPAGRSDVIVLQDQFAPRDLTQLAMTEVEQQLGVLAARLDLYPSDAWTLTAAAIRQDRAYVLPRPIQAALPAGDTLAERPAAAALARLEYRGGSVEVAATVARGASPLPGVALAGRTPVARHPDEDRLAVDGTLSLGKDVLRWDLVHARTDASALPGFSRRRTAAMLGWDRGLWRDANLSLQAIARRDATAQPGPGEAALVPLYQANGRLAQAYGPRQRFLTATLKQRFRTNHQLETGVMAGTGGQRAFVQRWEWQIRDGVALHARYQYLRGDSATLAGNLGYKRLLHAELRYHF